MVKSLVSFSGWLAKNATAFVIGIAVFTFFFPHIFDWVRGNTQTVILGIIMLTMGLTLTTDDFRILARRPLDIFIGACAQFIIMPGVAWTLVHVFHLEPALALGILLVGCCPGGVSSNVMSYLCHGDVAFSVGMSCASTLVAPVMTPLLMQFLGGQIIAIDTVGMFENIIIVTIIPVAVGCALNYFFSRRSFFPTLQGLMRRVALCCSSGPLLWCSVIIRWAIFWDGSPDAWQVSTWPRSARFPSRWVCRMPDWPPCWLPTSLLLSRLRSCLVPSAVPGIASPVRFWQDSICVGTCAIRLQSRLPRPSALLRFPGL